MKLTNIALCAKYSSNLDTPLTVVKGGNFERMQSNLQKIAEHKETFENCKELRTYLVNNIEELNFILSLATKNGIPSKLEKLLALKEALPERLSNFSLEDYKEMFKGYSNNCYYLYTLLYAARCKRKNGFTSTTNEFRRLLSELSEDDFKNFMVSFIAIDEKKLMPLFTLERFVINANKVEDVTEKLNMEEYNALVRYITSFTRISSDDIENVNHKALLNVLNKIYLNKVRQFVTEDKRSDYMESIIRVAKDCHFDHKYLSGFYRNVTKEFFETSMNVLDFVNVALGGKYYTLIEKAPTSYRFQNLMLYALTNKKFAFLDMLSANIDKVNELNNRDLENSMLVDNKTYTSYINLNELNAKDLMELATLPIKCFNLRRPTGETKVTPKELIALMKCEKENIDRLFIRLTCKIDEKILIIRQMNNIDFSFSTSKVSDAELDDLARRLSEKNIARRIEKMPYDVSAETMIRILALPIEFDNIVDEAKSNIELDFIVRNKLEIDLNIPLANTLNNFMQTDLHCKKMFKEMELSNDFLNKHADKIKEFCLKGNASIVMQYYDGVPKLQRESILKIAKAEMAGEMKRFKFFNIDKELEYTLSEKERNVWIDNARSEKNGIVIDETYSFDDTMLIGVKPNHTCMNYKDGGHKSCLLANFDSNKKILFAKVNGAIVGRAIIRLTKSLKEDENIDRKVEFLDVENEFDCDNSTTANERLTIFVERPYFACINGNVEATIRKQFIDLAMEKAREMGARLLASYNYGDCGLTNTRMNVFISHTKNGVQYMDSFGGENNASQEASYKSHSCYKAKI